MKGSALSLIQLVLSQDAESSLRQMGLGASVLQVRRLSLDLWGSILRLSCSEST